MNFENFMFKNYASKEELKKIFEEEYVKALAQCCTIPENSQEFSEISKRQGSFLFGLMNHPKRVYHSPKHVLDLIPMLRSEARLASFYHDAAYLQADGVVPPPFEKLKFENNQYLSLNLGLYKDVFSPIKYYAKICDIFSFIPDGITTRGVNEFISALLAAYELQEICTEKTILLIATCIEATQPFRGINPAPMKLLKRFEQVFVKNHIPVSFSELEQSFELSNADVFNFSFTNPILCLEKTWEIVFENGGEDFNKSNIKFFISLVQILKLIKNLTPDLIFTQLNYLEPINPDLEYKTLCERAKVNLAYFNLYFGSVLLDLIFKLSNEPYPFPSKNLHIKKAPEAQASWEALTSFETRETISNVHYYNLFPSPHALSKWGNSCLNTEVMDFLVKLEHPIELSQAKELRNKINRLAS